MDQGDIAEERGSTNPTARTLQRIAECSGRRSPAGGPGVLTPVMRLPARAPEIESGLSSS